MCGVGRWVCGGVWGCAQLLSCVPLFSTPISVHGISQARNWRGLPFSSPGDLPYPGIEPLVSVISCIGRWILATKPPGSPAKCIHAIPKWMWPQNIFLKDIYMDLCRNNDLDKSSHEKRESQRDWVAQAHETGRALSRKEFSWWSDQYSAHLHKPPLGLHGMIMSQLAP